MKNTKKNNTKMTVITGALGNGEMSSSVELFVVDAGGSGVGVGVGVTINIQVLEPSAKLVVLGGQG